MARVPQVSESADPEVAALIERIKARRGGALLDLDKALLNAPTIADGWNAFLGAVRTRCVLKGRWRELAILQVAVLNGADYEFNQHAPVALKEGMSQAQLDALRRGDRRPFDATELAILDYTDAMTRMIRVPDAIFAAVKERLPARDLVELTATIGAYNLVSRFLVALEIGH